MNQYPDFFVGSDTHRIDLELGHWVEIKTELSAGDWEDIDSQTLQYVASGGNGQLNRSERRKLARGKASGVEAVANLRISAGDIEVLKVLITKWSFENVPITKESIGKLKDEWTQKILHAFDSVGNAESPLASTSGEGLT